MASKDLKRTGNGEHLGFQAAVVLGKHLWDALELVHVHAHQRAAELLRNAVPIEHQIQPLARQEFRFVQASWPGMQALQNMTLMSAPGSISLASRLQTPGLWPWIKHDDMGKLIMTPPRQQSCATCPRCMA